MSKNANRTHAPMPRSTVHMRQDSNGAVTQRAASWGGYSDRGACRGNQTNDLLAEWGEEMEEEYGTD